MTSHLRSGRYTEVAPVQGLILVGAAHSAGTDGTCSSRTYEHEVRTWSQAQPEAPPRPRGLSGFVLALHQIPKPDLLPWGARNAAKITTTDSLFGSRRIGRPKCDLASTRNSSARASIVEVPSVKTSPIPAVGTPAGPSRRTTLVGQRCGRQSNGS